MLNHREEDGHHRQGGRLVQDPTAVATEVLDAEFGDRELPPQAKRPWDAKQPNGNRLQMPLETSARGYRGLAHGVDRNHRITLYGFVNGRYCEFSVVLRELIQEKEFFASIRFGWPVPPLTPEQEEALALESLYRRYARRRLWPRVISTSVEQ